MSAISLKSITGITSITTPTGVDNQLTLHTNDTTQRVKVTQSGIEAVGVATFQDIDVDGHTNLDNVSIAGITTTTENIRIQGDNKYLTIGAGNDIGLVHTGSESFIANATGHLTHRSDVHKWENYAGSSEYLRILSGGAVVVAGTSAYSDGTFGEAKLQFNTKTGNHIGACSVADSTNSITHVLFKNPNGAIASVGTHGSDFIALTGNTERLRILSDGTIQYKTAGGKGYEFGASGSSASSAANVFAPASYTIAFGTNGNERLRINSDGDVLINTTTTPTADIKLLVSGNGGVSSGSYFSFRGDYGNVPEPAAYAIKYDSSLTNLSGAGGLHQYAYGGIAFNLGGQDRVNFKTTGEVGINTTVPSALLNVNTQSSGVTDAIVISRDVYGMVGKLTNSSGALVVTSNKQLILRSDPSAQFTAEGSLISFEIDGAEKVRIKNNSYVGIGTNNPGQILHLSASSGDVYNRVDTNVNGGLLVYVQGTQRSVFANDSAFSGTITDTGIGAKGNMIFRTGTSSYDERLRIASNGKIGINNNNPQFPLHLVNTSSTFNSAALIKGDNSTSGQGAYATFTNTSDSKSAYFGIDGAGLFAIDPGAALVGTSGSEPIIFATNGNAERFRIQASTTDTIVVQQASGADIFTVSSDTAETRQQNSLTYVNYGLAIGKSRTQGSTGYGANGVYTPYFHGEGEKVFGIDSSWSQAELRRFFGNDTVEWYAEEGAPGGYCIKVTGACNVGSNYGSGFPYLPIDDDDQFFQEMWIRTDAGNSVNHYGGSIQLDKDFANPTGNPGSFGYELMINHTTNDATWRRRTATLGPNHGTSLGQFRNNHTGGKRKYCTPQLLLNYQHNSGSRVCYISGWAWYRRRSRGNTYFGSISKGSGSFQIKHPLEAKKDTHYLRHSFIEGPKCDNIYRGKATLSSGTATVNLDTEGTMTEGTFVALNDNVQCYTTNETGWGAVKGSVSGNILTITAQDNTSTDTISWMVVGERKDDEIKASDLTDGNGKLLVEPQVDQQYVGLSTAPMVAPGMES